MNEWIKTTIESLGYVGIGLLMFLENLFPPIPSELIMPLAGYTAALPNSKIDIVPAIIAGIVGTMLGALPWYYVGKLVGEENLKRVANKYGKWIFLSSKDIEKADSWFDRHNEKAVFLGRLVPGIRTLISLPAGLSSMSLAPFLLYSTLGTALWVGLLTYAGYFLGNNYHLVEEYLGPVSKIVVVGLAIAFIIWAIGKRQKSKGKI